MEKSIENIWKDGFLQTDALVAPKLNDLYNQKSKNIIDKFIRMMNINLIALVIFSFAIMIWWYFTGVVYIGLFIFLLLNAFVVYGYIHMKRMQNLDVNSSSYEYLISFNKWLKSMLDKNAMIMRFFYPLMFLAAFATMWYSYDNEAVLQQFIAKHFPDIYWIAGIPSVLLVGVIAFAIIIAIFGKKIYQWDVNIVYGRVFKKLEEIIADMEELRK